MTKTTTTTPDLAAQLAEAQKEQAAAAELERRLSEQKARADAARLKAEQEQQAARVRWAEAMLASYDEANRTAGTALAEAEAAFQASIETPETIIPAWMERQRRRVDLYIVHHTRRQAATILGHAGQGREPAVPYADFAGDVAKLMNDWSLNLVTDEAEKIRESLAAATTGREASRG